MPDSEKAKRQKAAIYRAFEKLPVEQQKAVDRLGRGLSDLGIRGMGPLTTREILGAIGIRFENLDWPKIPDVQD